MSIQITEQPVDQRVEDGEVAVFSVTATGENLSYQWWGETIGSQGLMSPLVGEINASLAFTALLEMNYFHYYCVITDGVDTVDTRVVRLYVREANYVVPYTIDEDVAELQVSGFLPRDTKRNNLYRLLLANGISIIKNAEGNPHFTFIRSTTNADEIPDDDIFMSGSVEYNKTYASAIVAEHTYTDLLTANAVTIFDNTDGDPVSNQTVWFDKAPIIVGTIQADSGLTLIFATENSAIVTGQGKLTGIPYTHDTRVIHRDNSTGDKDKTVSVTENTMVNMLNSENLLARLLAYYCNGSYFETIKNEIKRGDQKCGNKYSFSNPFGESTTAFLTKMDSNASTFNRASCEFVAGSGSGSGYDPPGQSGLYQHCIILDKATFAEDGGTWTVPQEILEMADPQFRVVIIGGGAGGSSGSAGSNGSETTTLTYANKWESVYSVWSGANGGKGGSGAGGGKPGRVKVVTIQNPSSSYSYTIGDGGLGGGSDEGNPDETQVPGEDGTASTFDSFSSADEDSYIPVAGVYNPIFGVFYATYGFSGFRGGDGGARRIDNADGSFTLLPDGGNVEGEDGTVYCGGKTGVSLVSVDGLPECKMLAYGGNGAGAAVGVDREDHPEMDGKSDQEAYWEVVEDGV